MLSEGCVSWRLLRAGSARLTEVLRPQLGELLARERAVRITQALIDGWGDPEALVETLLPQLAPAARRHAAGMVATTWMELRNLR